MEQTIRVWESYAGRDPSPENIDALERIFGTEAPGGEPADASSIVAAIDRLTAAIEAQTAKRVEWERGVLSALVELLPAAGRSADPVAGPLEGARR